MCKTETYRLTFTLKQNAEGFWNVSVCNGDHVLADLPQQFPTAADAASAALFRLSCDISFKGASLGLWEEEKAKRQKEQSNG